MILESVAFELGRSAKVYLFGSRVDDTKRGGDIDLLIEVPGLVDNRIKKKINIIGRIHKKIGEQKIDLIITHKGEFKSGDEPLVIKNARKDGVPL